MRDHLDELLSRGGRGASGQPLPPEWPAELPPDDYELQVLEATTRIRAQREARRRVDEEERSDRRSPELVTLEAFLAVPDDDVVYRVDGLLPVGGNVILSAQFKAGKSTLIANLLRSLATGEPFLGRFETRPTRAVAVLDLELDERTLRRWLREQGIRYPAAVRLAALRGRVSELNVLDPAARSAWAEAIRGADVLIVDPLRPLMDSLRLDENHDAGQVLSALDELKAEAGVSELVVVHHAGHGSERSRGDSRLRDWPDAEWSLRRESDDERAPRYFAAFGRDVDVREGRLEYVPETRQLQLVGGSRLDARFEEVIAEIRDAIEAAGECLSGRGIETALAHHPRETVRSAMRLAVTSGRLLASAGPRRSTLHCIPEET